MVAGMEPGVNYEYKSEKGGQFRTSIELFEEFQVLNLRCDMRINSDIGKQ